MLACDDPIGTGGGITCGIRKARADAVGDLAARGRRDHEPLRFRPEQPRERGMRIVPAVRGSRVADRREAFGF